jgi:TolB-like protein/Tfp pilus assembly protein PilF
MKLFEELKRRNVIKAAIAYVVVSWVLLQVLSIVLPTVDAPQWVMKTMMLVMVIAFPIWVFIAWVYEVTPEGLKKTEKVSKDQSITATTNKRLNVLILVGIVVAIAVTLLQPKSGYISSNTNDFSIAVLPFDDLSSDKDSEWFCDGVTEDILTYLSKVDGLKVISRTSVMQYKDRKKTIPEIAKELGVSFIVEGSVRKHGNDVRITAQLIKANDEHMWAENYSGTMDNVFKLQGDVSQQIVQQLKIKISPEVEKQLQSFPTTNVEAYQAFLKGRSHAERFNKEDIKIAVEFFEKAIELDPNYAEAYAELGILWVNFRDENKEKGKAYIEKAYELNPNSSTVNSYFGAALLNEDRGSKEGKKYLERALELNPNDARAQERMAMYYAFSESDDHDNAKAVEYVSKAVELEPFSTQANTFKTFALIDNNEFDKAESHMLEKKTLFPKDIFYNMRRYLIDHKIEFKVKENKDQTAAFDIYQEAISKYPENAAFLTQELAGAYDGILNDQDAYLKYAKQAYEIDSTLYDAISAYHEALLESGYFEEVEALQNSENYLKNTNKFRQLLNKHYYFYFKKDKQNQLNTLKDSLMTNQFTRKAFTYAQIGDKDNLKILIDKLNSTNKALVFAILKQRDSMYHYLNKEDITDIEAQFPNSRPEMDPYRKEPQYIEFLKKHHFPIDQQKN